MRILITLFAMIASVSASAQDSRTNTGPHSLNVLASFPRGGVSLGGGYEYLYQDSMGVEAHLRYFSKQDAAAKRADGMIIVGAGAAAHFYKKSWDLAFNPSFNIINIDSATPGGENKTTFGPGLSVSLTTQITPNVGVGFDWGNYWIWFDDAYAGKRVDDLALKARFSF